MQISAQVKASSLMAEHVFFLIFSRRVPLQAIKISQQTEQLLSGKESPLLHQVVQAQATYSNTGSASKNMHLRHARVEHFLQIAVFTGRLRTGLN
jgi:hypothetical protein